MRSFCSRSSFLGPLLEGSGKLRCSLLGHSREAAVCAAPSSRRVALGLRVRTFAAMASDVPSYSKHYINGAWVDSAGSTEYLDVVDSNSGEVCARIVSGTAADTESAIEAAASAFPAWSRKPLAERKKCVSGILAEYMKVKGKVATALRSELGAPKILAEKVQANMLPAHFNAALQFVDQIEWEKELNNTLVVKEPIGVVGCITPWNWPLNQIAAKCAPALLAGCTVVLKPSEITPLNAILLAEAVHASGLPAGVFNMVLGTGPACGEVLATHPKVDMVSFTGSTPVGRKLHALGASTIKRVRTELGGKSALIVLDGAPQEQVLRMATNVIGNTGQSCNALTRMLVPKAQYEPTVTMMKAAFEKVRVVDARSEDAKPGDMGPLSSLQQYNKVRSYIQKGVEEGARLVTGGLDHPEGVPQKGFFVKPTILADVHNSMTVAKEEIFGPVLCILPYTSEEEAIAIANDTIYGLNNAVVGKDQEKAMDVARQLRSGQVMVNTMDGNIGAPFGGYKQSGDGREWGTYGIEEFLQVKAMHRPARL